MKSKTFIIEGKPIGAPRMSQRDRWKKRPCVLRYFAWRDKAREAAGELPPTEQIESVSWVAYFEPPASWSKRKRAEHLGKLHRSKPDRDNLDKSLLDALFKEDSQIASGEIQKRWGETDRFEVTIVYQEGESQ